MRSNKTRKIFITGGAGFIGSYLSAALKALGDIIYIYDIRINQRDDVRDRERLQKALIKFRPQGVVHLAAVSRVEEGFQDPERCIAVNIDGTANVLQNIASLKTSKKPWFIFGGSREVFGNPQQFPVKESFPKTPTNIYAVTKVAGENLASTYASNYGLQARTIRFSGVYTGLEDRLQRVIPRFLIAALQGQPLIVEGGQQFFDFVHINDSVQGILKCMEHVEQTTMPYEDFNLATGKSITVQDLARLIIELTKSKSKLKVVEPRFYDVKGFTGDPKKAKEQLGWRATVDLEAGLQSVIPSFQKAYTRKS